MPKSRGFAPIVTEARWKEVITRFEAGDAKEEICTGTEGWPTKRQWNHRMQFNAGFHRRVTLAWERRKQEAESQIDAGLAFYVDSGKALKSVMTRATHCRYVHKMQFRPDMRLLASAAKRRRRQIEAFNREPLYAAALTFIMQGGSVNDIPGAPSTIGRAAFQNRLNDDAEFRALYDAAIALRPRIKGSRLGFVDWDGTIAAIRSGKTIIQARKIKNGPTIGQWDYRLATDTAFAAIVAEAKMQASAARKAERNERERQGKKRKAIIVDRSFERAAPSRLPISVDLHPDALVARVRNTVPRGLPQDVRDDVTSEMVLAVLQGELDIADLNKRVRKFITKYYREAGTFKHVDYDKVSFAISSPL
jgi:hypothetical protein